MPGARRALGSGRTSPDFSVAIGRRTAFTGSAGRLGPALADTFHPRVKADAASATIRAGDLRVSSAAPDT